MSGVGGTLRWLWAKDPVVSFSVAIGTIGVILPLTVPKLWGKYPDTIENEKRQAVREKIREDAAKRPGL